MGDKIRRKAGSDLDLIGEEIVRAWEAGALNNNTVDRQALINALTYHLDKNLKNGRRRTVEFDLIFDEDVDGDTRVVWLAIPTPDPKKISDTDDESWQDYIDREFGPRGARNKARLEKLALSVLFGCGR